MDKEEIYEFIGELAIALYSKKIQISLSSLNSILKDKKCEYGNNKGLGQGVSAAYRHWEEKDPVIHHAIAYTYTNEGGGFAWDKPTQ
ncbi:MAG TPA: hypothetical protein ENI73_08390 [Spirochaetes bacterium]|nr:hypothetical protein [Spirochaetota bacterium]